MHAHQLRLEYISGTPFTHSLTLCTFGSDREIEHKRREKIYALSTAIDGLISMGHIKEICATFLYQSVTKLYVYMMMLFLLTLSSNNI